MVAYEATVAVSGDDCVAITPSRPDWDPGAITFGTAGAIGSVTWPVEFHATQSCSGLDTEGELDAAWSTPILMATSEACTVYIQLLGAEDEEFNVRWYPQP